MAHVFIVNPRTFPLHLQYQFAGTTAGLKQQRNVGLYADIARVRPGHRAYFYLENRGFYGPFIIDRDIKAVWWDKLDPTFLQAELNLRLIYRVQVLANNTYPLGVSEWDALDCYLREPTRCLWSLVYRKLKGKRGCTMIFPWEDDFLLGLIQQTNEKHGKPPLRFNDDEHLTWNPTSSEIEIVAGRFPGYAVPSADHVSPPEDPLARLLSASGSEAHLQAFLIQNYGRFADSEVIFGKAETIAWVGNEVASGLGMQKIDIFVINEENDRLLFRVVELKKDPPDERTVWQLERYVEWTKIFVPEAKADNIRPVLLCRNLDNIPLSTNAKRSFREFNDAKFALPLKYVECVKGKDRSSVQFHEVEYL